VVLVVADDLIWSTRLADAFRHAGAEPRPVRTLALLEAGLANADGCLVDLTSRAYDGVAAIAAASQAGLPVIAVGQHDDAALRRTAREAGAARVFAYRRLFEHGDQDLADWVRSLAIGRGPEPHGGRS
jgi:DNA-binding response OmpR family regulator